MIIVLTSAVSSFAEIYLSTYLSADIFHVLVADGKEILANPPVDLMLILLSEIVKSSIVFPKSLTTLIWYVVLVGIDGNQLYSPNEMNDIPLFLAYLSTPVLEYPLIENSSLTLSKTSEPILM